MRDWEFLDWVANRLVYVYSESPNVDFVLKLGAIVRRLRDEEFDRITPNVQR